MDTGNQQTVGATDETQEADDDNDLVSGLGTLMRELEVGNMEIQCDDDASLPEDDQNIEDDTTYTEHPILVDYFRKIKDDIIVQCKNKGAPDVCTKGKTFWIEPPAPYFALYTGPADPKKLYYPRDFLWQPHRLSLSKDLVCPNSKCTGRKLNSKGYNHKPYARRVVDLDRYRCPRGAGGCGLSLNARDDKILEQLPPQLQAEFPAYLTHRSAVSKNLGNLLRAAVQNGLGVHRLQRLLRELHVLRYATRRLQYANTLVHRQEYPTVHDTPTAPGKPVKYKRFSKFSDPEGYSGCIPSTGYLRLVYTALMDQLRSLIDKELAILAGVILKGDHSFKVPKHMAKLGGSSAFTALYTVCNEYEEIRL
ncbi:hypothetical protein BJV82DRAFT_345657 [Fennellomyces sp. T-0311]|nr:hypothetical protein BJV82DRAFT_345533 [Fennellomyces sp. T-0311]KAI8147394.1 hypothetical protein BJV82DRAFT_345657 [Fennellomyces sp. T-0311]